VASQRIPRVTQPGLPPFPRANRRRVVEQSVFFLLLAQPGKLGVDPKERVEGLERAAMDVERIRQ